MQLANLLPRLHTLGADLAAVVVDPPGRNAAMAARWHLPFPIHADPGGERVLQPLDLWNPDERGGIAWPALVVADGDDREAWRSRSRDFADRPPDDADLIAAVTALGAPPLDPVPPAWVADVEPEQDRGAFTTERYGPFFLGIRTATMALAGRLTDPGDQAEARAMSAMATGFGEAWRARRDAAG